MTGPNRPRRPYVRPAFTLVDLQAAGRKARKALSGEFNLATLQPQPTSTSNVMGVVTFGPSRHPRPEDDEK